MMLPKLQEFMKRNNISDEELAVKSLVSVRSIQNAKRCKSINRNTGKRIAQALKIKIDILEGKINET